MDTEPVQWLDQYDRRVQEAIRNHGCFLQHVVGRYGQSVPTSFCYTTGFFGLGHPELLVFGLDQADSARLLNGVFAMVHDGRVLVPGEVLRFPGRSESFLVERVPNPGDILFVANRFYAGPLLKSVPAYQLTWSVGGAFPWEAGYSCRPESQPRPGTFSAILDGAEAGPCSCGRH